MPKTKKINVYFFRVRERKEGGKKQLLAINRPLSVVACHIQRKRTQ
jgi:hypothetical protein